VGASADCSKSWDCGDGQGSLSGMSSADDAGDRGVWQPLDSGAHFLCLLAILKMSASPDFPQLPAFPQLSINVPKGRSASDTIERYTFCRAVYGLR
jgi:hypothetical protein